MTLRLAHSGDADAIAAVYAPVVRETAISFELDPPTAEEMERRRLEVVPAYPWLVAQDEQGDVVGYAYGHPFNERAAYAWTAETSVYVAEAARGRGVGGSLYRAVLAILRVQGYREVIAGIRVPNAASVALHESFGFARVASYTRVGWKFDEWHDVGIWQLTLAADGGPPLPIRTIDDIAEDVAEILAGSEG
ncbi:MAG: GNAT family N-acetyltransferase [Acidimicrobiales bacterium]